MITMRIEETTDVTVCGKKVWISGQDNMQFGNFWEECNKSGFTAKLKEAANADSCTKSKIMGVSRVEEDPNNRAFYFYVATEAEEAEGCESFVVKGGKWAVFSNNGALPFSLVDAEMEAFMKWLPTSEYQHDFRPELEVYPEDGRADVEFWLPIVEK